MPMRMSMSWAVLLSMSLALAAAPALAGKHLLRVTATILVACSLTTQGVHCTGRAAKVAYRINTADNGVVTIEF